MSEYRCDNCQHPSAKTEKICSFCGFPLQGTKEEKIRYNTKIFNFKDLVEESDKSVKSIFSLFIIFIFMGLVVLAFSLIFGENHYAIALFYIVAGKVYYLLSRVGKRTAYIMMILAFLFYLTHTIFEFSYGYYPKSPVNLDESFIESKGSSIIYAIIPLAYILLRLALMIVLVKYLYTQFRLKSEEKIVRFIRGGKVPQ
jgi:ribosomal protein L37E